jgi:hypothetical protein
VKILPATEETVDKSQYLYLVTEAQRMMKAQ